MPPIDQYIAELVLRYEDLVLPKFGRFVKSNQVSKSENGDISLKQQIDFQSDSSISDELLIHYLAKREQLTIPEAQALIEDYIRQIKIEIYNNKTVRIAHLGVFRLDEDSNQLFHFDEIHAINPQYFGLESVEKPKIEVSKPKQVEPVSELKPELQQKEEKTSNKRFWWISTAIVACLALILIAKSAFDVFPSDEKPIENQGNEAMYVFIDLSDIKWVSFEGLEDELEDEFSGELSTNLIKKGYIIVFGVFENHLNAKKLQKRLLSKFGPTQIEDFKNRKRVNSPLFSSKQEALVQLRKAKRVSRGAWLLKID